MSVIWSGITEEGAVVPVQVTEEGKVVATGDGPQGDYLPITGGTLTGDLNVSDKITLATNGSAEFAGSVSASFVYAGDINGQFSRLNTTNLSVRNDSGGDAIVVYKDGTAPGDKKITLESEGSAEFKGNVKAASFSTGDAKTNSSGYGAYVTTSSSNSTLILRDSVEGSTDTAISINKPSGNLVKIGYNGSAEFKGDVTVGGEGKDGNDAGVSIRGQGLLQVTRADKASSVFNGYTKGSSTPTSQIRADGAASFTDGKCGFTSDGELIFSSRGTRYKLFVSQGVCQAEEFTREMELKEKAEQFIADKRETKPSQPQPEVTSDNDNA